MTAVQPALPSGTVTFLFTDIEGSTRLWEDNPVEMQAALERHDEILRSAIEDRGGYVFSTAGDAFAAGFSRAADAVAAAVGAQLELGAEPWPASTAVRVRMGVHTGAAQERDGDYFGPALNRGARVMAAGHGGQILAAASTVELVTGCEFVDLGEHQLKDLSSIEHLFQVSAPGLESVFETLRTIDELPGNLPIQPTSFVGRDAEMHEVAELVRAHQLVTLTGVGGVGKTRLAVQVAAEMISEFPDGVWLVELAPVTDPTAVPDAVASALGVSLRAGMSVTAGVGQALSAQRLLVVLDNCEHVLDAVAELVDTVLARAETAKVIATSREGLRVGAEQLWPVASLDVTAGVTSAAVELFAERARAVEPGFELAEPAQAEAVTEICRRLDGIALAIELAAARMVSMSAQEVRDRLDDRFRLLSGARRGQDRHETLRQAVAWSYDLLSEDEQALLDRCSVFAGGFDLATATQISGDGDDLDEYAVLDHLDSLVRKSLVTTEHVQGRTRYGLLETIRVFAEDQLGEKRNIDAVRDRHASYFAEQATSQWDRWDAPDQRTALDWVNAEFANLRSAFRWATDRKDFAAATAIAANTTLLAWQAQQFEPIGWAEEILTEATAANVAQLPRLYTGASLCLLTGGTEAAIDYAETASRLEDERGYDPFEPGLSSYWEALAQLMVGQPDRTLEIYREMAAGSGLAQAAGLAGLVNGLAITGGTDEAMTLADEALATANTHGNPVWIAFALAGQGHAFAQVDPRRALEALREGLDYAREHDLLYFETLMTRDAAGLEAVHGEPDRALELFDAAIDSFHRSGNVAHVRSTLGLLSVFFGRLGEGEISATILGMITRKDQTVIALADMTRLRNDLHSMLGKTAFDKAVARGASMEVAAAVTYSLDQIRTAQRHRVHFP